MTPNSKRLWASIMDIARHGALAAGGSNRQALTDEDRAARDLLVRWGREAGCDVQIDALGNMFLIREGSSPESPVVLVGSHLDTQPHGGKFDGVYGVMADLELIRMLNEANVTTGLRWSLSTGPTKRAPGLRRG